LLAGMGVIAVWALGEMLRWRIKYRRLLKIFNGGCYRPVLAGLKCGMPEV
jgi:hypothetical protein